MAEELGKKSLKRVWEEREELQEEHDKIKRRYQENNKELQKLMDDKENEISQLKKQNEEMQKMIQDLQKQSQKLQASSKADQKKIRMLVKNNNKKRKLLESDEIMYWNEYALQEAEDDEAQERYEELEACWYSSAESADESDEK